jgi:hypothetical protein
MQEPRLKRSDYPPGESKPARSLFVSVISDFDLLEGFMRPWEELAGAAIEPNPFYEPWMLIPALRSLAAGKDVRVVLVVDRSEDPPGLCGVFPIERVARYKRLPVAAFRLWQHIYCALCTPLIRADCASETLDAFTQWLASERTGALMEFNHVSGDGPFNELLNDRSCLRGKQGLADESHTRALFRPRESADSYISAALRRDHRKDLRRKTRRLREQGRVEFNSLEPDGDVDRWVSEFLELEASGWKRQDGGAFACDDAKKDYFQTVAKSAFERKRLMMLALRLDGRPIAMKCNILSAPGSFAFKIAFDEDFYYYSPGVLLELENIRVLHSDSRIEWMDSCATPEHPMINRLWLDRRPIRSVLTPTGNRAGDLVISALPFMRSINRKVRALQVKGL